MRSAIVSLSLLLPLYVVGVVDTVATVDVVYVVGVVDAVATVDVVMLRSKPLTYVLEEVEMVLVDRSGCSLLETVRG